MEDFGRRMERGKVRSNSGGERRNSSKIKSRRRRSQEEEAPYLCVMS